jgi:hypothetical protein
MSCEPGPLGQLVGGEPVVRACPARPSWYPVRSRRRRPDGCARATAARLQCQAMNVTGRSRSCRFGGSRLHRQIVTEPLGLLVGVDMAPHHASNGVVDDRSFDSSRPRRSAMRAFRSGSGAPRAPWAGHPRSAPRDRTASSSARRSTAPWARAPGECGEIPLHTKSAFTSGTPRTRTCRSRPRPDCL